MARPKSCKCCNKPKRPKGNKFKELPGYCECGRPTKFDKDTIQKLEDAFSNSFPDREACFYAGVSPTALYEYQKKNPEFAERKESLKLKPNMVARKTIVEALKNTNDAWRWLEKKDKDFMPTSKLEHGGSVEVVSNRNLSKGEKEALKLLRVARKQRIESESDKME